MELFNDENYNLSLHFILKNLTTNLSVRCAFVLIYRCNKLKMPEQKFLNSTERYI